jgi:hypothetical protein
LIFLKIIDHIGNPGLVSVDKILFISSGDQENEVKSRIHLVGDIDHYVDTQNSFDDVVERLSILLGY